MLILFDLDDTLIETSKCLTGHYLKWAFEAMVKSGLKVDDPQKAFEELVTFNQHSLTFRLALETFWQKWSKENKILNAGLETLKTPLTDDMVIESVPGAIEVLDALQIQHTLALVTKGHRELQLQKMEKAGIQPERFSKLIIGNGPSKKLDYQTVLDELDVHPSEGIVCGDRIPLDLTPAKELGLYTVHFRNGRGKTHSEPKESVDKVITTLKELQEVFAKL